MKIRYLTILKNTQRLIRRLTAIFIIGMIFSSHSMASLQPGGNMELTIQSSAFNNNGSIPTKYSCNGDNISPPIHWKNIPAKTNSLVLIVDDPDAPMGVWDHWIIFNIPKTTTQFSENLTALPTGAQYGKNSWGKLSYGGPCPPSGEHRYIFTLYALDTLLDLSQGADKTQIENAMQGHILATAKLMGKYKK